MNDINKGNYEALTGEYEDQQTVLADESSEEERMRRRADDMVRYGIQLGHIEGEDMEKAIELALKVVKSFTPEQINTLDAKIKEIEEENIRAKDERRRAMEAY
jgi:hypothetical protein